ncbi:RsbRD N-terminal domain-containing protein [Burkholderia stagnalis]|uniref:RsbRD N-terminal domain-containing protein n=1 Tax=Burkholderia stagnalis TaxID=1503054 RepID=UPI0018C68783|nr:RsbRD N-terminal domain-containing protein [Burkholderia stagnalis]
MMMLPDFIDANVETLATDWVDQAQRLGATTLSARALDVSARRLLKALANDMRTAQSDALQLAKGRGERPLNAPDVAREARRHADDRLTQGFSLNDVVAE